MTGIQAKIVKDPEICGKWGEYILINLHNLSVERARLLTHCIEIMTKEMDAKGLEVYESSVKSLGVSLFIHMNKYLP